MESLEQKRNLDKKDPDCLWRVKFNEDTSVSIFWCLLKLDAKIKAGLLARYKYKGNIFVGFIHSENTDVYIIEKKTDGR